MTTDKEQILPVTPWLAAQRQCWQHVATATRVIDNLERLSSLNAMSVILVMSSTSPTIMITPVGADNIGNVRQTCRQIATMLNSPFEWERLNINDDWVLRLKTSEGIVIDVLTRIRATKESPIEL